MGRRGQLHLLSHVRCVACGLETTQRPLSRCTFTPEDLDEQFDGAIGYLVEPADSSNVSRPGLGLQPPVNQARHRPHVRGSRGLSGAVRACRGLSGPVGPCGRPATRVGEARYADLSRRGHVVMPLRGTSKHASNSTSPSRGHVPLSAVYNNNSLTPPPKNPCPTYSGPTTREWS